MAILTLGVSYRRAPIELLERLAFDDDDLAKAYHRASDLDGVEGAVVLSTCNRVEVYGEVPSYHAGFLSLKRLLAETRGIALEDLADPLYAQWDRDAADHLFAVAAGLDSMVLGETQIHAQVREALRRAQAEDAATRSLTGLFHAASRAGRRVRQETGLGAAPDAFVAVAADLASEALGGLDGKQVTVIGAGTMAGLAVKHLRARGVGSTRILNRSLERARALADRSQAEHGGLDELPTALEQADLVVSATGAAGAVIQRTAVAYAMRSRAGHPLVLVDLAVPRDVEPEAAYVEDVHLVDIVRLREHVAREHQETTEELASAHAIVSEEVRRWETRRRGDRHAPLIRALREHGDDVVTRELDRFSNRLSDLTPDEREAVEALARGIAAKLLHDPIVALKERAEPGDEHVAALARLLGISIDAPDPGP